MEHRFMHPVLHSAAFTQKSSVRGFLPRVIPFLLATSLAPHAFAGEPGASVQSSLATTAEEVPSLDAARAAFLEGRALMEQQSWAPAAEKFEYAARAKNTPGLRYYVGFCLEKAGRPVEARREYQAAAELLETTPAADVERLIPEAIERIETMVSFVALSVLPEGAVLSVDDVPTPWESKLVLNPGDHQILVKHPDYKPHVQSVTTVAGQTLVLQVELKQRSPQEPASLAPTNDTSPVMESEPKTSGARRAVFWTSVSVGTAGLGTGIVGAVLFSGATRRTGELGDEVDEMASGGEGACTDPDASARSTCEELNSAGSRRDVAGNLMLGGFAAAGAGALGAVISHFFWPDSSERLNLEAQLSRDLAYFSLGRRF